MLQSLRQFAALAATMASSRIELAGLELGEAVERNIINAVLGLAALLLGLLTLLALSALAVLLAGEAQRPTVLLILALVYAAGGLAAALVLRSRLRQAPPLLAATLAELRQDAQTLGRNP